MSIINYILQITKILTNTSDSDLINRVVNDILSALPVEDISSSLLPKEKVTNQEIIENTINNGAPVTIQITTVNPRHEGFRCSDVLETTVPEKINGLFFCFKPNKKSINFMSKNNAYLKIEVKYKDSLRGNLLLPANYILEEPDMRTRDQYGYVDSMLVYKILHGSTHSNMIFIENLPFFSIFSKQDINYVDRTNLYLSEFDNVVDNLKDKNFIFKMLETGFYKYIRIYYDKKIRPQRDLINKCLFKDALNTTIKYINYENRKVVTKNLKKALAVLDNENIRNKLINNYKGLENMAGCYCNDKYCLQYTGPEQICPVSPLEKMKYCFKTALNSFAICKDLISSPVYSVFPNYKPMNYTVGNILKTDFNTPIFLRKENKLKTLCSMICSSKSIFEIRSLVSLYLSSCCSNISTKSDMFHIESLFDCRYDMLRFKLEEGSSSSGIVVYTKPSDTSFHSKSINKNGAIIDGEANSSTKKDAKNEETIIIEEDNLSVHSESNSEDGENTANKENGGGGKWGWLAIGIASFIVIMLMGLVIYF